MALLDSNFENWLSFAEEFQMAPATYLAETTALPAIAVSGVNLVAPVVRDMGWGSWGLRLPRVETAPKMVFP